MYVPPFFPEPETVDLNVAAETYDARLTFIRSVVHGHALSVLLITVVATTVVSPQLIEYAGWVTVGALLVLSAIRRVANGSRLDLVLSLVVFPVLAIALGSLFRGSTVIASAGVGMVVSVLVALIYVYACGRDFSFLGQFTLSGGVASGLLAILASLGHASWAQVSIAILSAWAYLAYYTYDLASLLQRRRRREVIEAVIDLYRDLLNFLTYGFRVWHHWRTIRI